MLGFFASAVRFRLPRRLALRNNDNDNLNIYIKDEEEDLNELDIYF